MVTRCPPVFFESTLAYAKADWDTLDQRPSLRGPWLQLFEQLKRNPSTSGVLTAVRTRDVTRSRRHGWFAWATALAVTMVIGQNGVPDGGPAHGIGSHRPAPMGAIPSLLLLTGGDGGQ
jgi:hypothetical protein